LFGWCFLNFAASGGCGEVKSVVSAEGDVGCSSWRGVWGFLGCLGFGGFWVGSFGAVGLE
jgi:hypothetical protein